MTESDDIVPITKERLKALPISSGVYLMKDRAGTVIYVGKAKNLKARVRSYFSGGDERHSVQYLMRRVYSIDTLVTEDERQAIILEADLIRKYKPRYNIRLKDDRSYLFARIDLNAEWPRIELVRASKDDGARYLGPFTFGYELRTLLDVIKRAVPLRTCSDSVLHNRVRPCLEYQIKRCAGPCCLDVDRVQYLEWVRQAMQILQGRNESVLVDLAVEMERASQELRFEDAATLRDRLRVLQQVQQDTPQFSSNGASQDAFGVYREGDKVEVSVLMVRNGRLFEARTFGFPEVEVPDEEVLSSFLGQFYRDGREVPEEVLLPSALEDLEVREEMLREVRGSKVSLIVPKIGPKTRLIALAYDNAKENHAARFTDGDRSERLLRALQHELGLDELPRTIECVDVSHFQGGSTVASVVALLDGKPDKSRYRHFNLSQEGKPDDFASMREVVGRHLSRGAEENTLPDLLIIDGGPGQLSQARAVREELGLLRPTLVGLAKKRTAKVPYYAPGQGEGRGKERKFERIYVEASKTPIVLKEKADSTHLLERIRDEAHRFAITFHRRVRARKMFRSALEDIPGVGAARRAELLRTFGSVKAIAAATPEELTERCRVPARIAERIVSVVRKRREKGAAEQE